MATAEHPAASPTPRDERPITRTELREELAYALRDYVTKTDLREELAYALQHYATKTDLAQLEIPNGGNGRSPNSMDGGNDVRRNDRGNCDCILYRNRIQQLTSEERNEL